eukprot:scaffold25035_cov162-Cylindrotheca_fusiformis.AAC.2
MESSHNQSDGDDDILTDKTLTAVVTAAPLTNDQWTGDGKILKGGLCVQWHVNGNGNSEQPSKLEIESQLKKIVL